MRRVHARVRCPICGGHPGLPRGEGRRCAGFIDGEHAFCTREEYAGRLREFATSPPSFRHRLHGGCACGTAHGASTLATRRPRPDPTVATSRSTRANKIWSETRPPRGTLVERYFTHRGLDLDQVAERVRFHPGLYARMNGELVQSPAAVFACIDRIGRRTAIHAIMLDPQTGQKNPIFGGQAKRSYGSTGGTTICVREGVESEPIVLTEGPEDAISAAVAPRAARWGVRAAIGAGGLASAVPLPDERPVLIVGDDDAAGRRAAAKAAAAYGRRGHPVAVVRAPAGSDLNDLLRREGIDAVDALLRDAARELHGAGSRR